MTNFGYPDLPIHKKEHSDLKDNVLDFLNKFNEGKARLDILLMNFLRDWLLKHIMESDLKYKAFIREKGLLN